MYSERIYQLKNCGTVYWLPALECVGGVFKAFQTSTMELFTKKLSNIDLKPSSIFAKRSTSDGWMGPKNSFGGWHKTNPQSN